MSNDSDRALKLYVEEIASPPSIDGLPSWNPLCAAVLNLTGWSLSWASPSAAANCGIEFAAGVPNPPCAKESVSPLVNSLGGLMQELQRTRKALWEREGRRVRTAVERVATATAGRDDPFAAIRR